MNQLESSADGVATARAERASNASATENHPVVPIDLRNPGVAALLAWLWPGAGHIYQRRYGKGLLFMACILGTYFFGLGLGDGRVVYADFRGPQMRDMRWPFVFQAGVGLPVMPAVVKAMTAKDRLRDEPSPRMAPPSRLYDELSEWHRYLGRYFELGTLYTMVAGLLNILVIFDAYGGPAFPDNRQRDPPTGGSARDRTTGRERGGTGGAGKEGS